MAISLWYAYLLLLQAENIGNLPEPLALMDACPLALALRLQSVKPEQEVLLQVAVGMIDILVHLLLIVRSILFDAPDHLAYQAHISQ
jgi:hypothetical protein